MSTGDSAPPGGSRHPELALWAANVGGPVALDGAPPARTPLAGLTVLSWNVAIGRARVAELLGRLAEGAFDEALGRPVTDAARPLVLLLQEAYRAGGGVPPDPRGAHHGGQHPGAELPHRTDIVALAGQRGLSLRYAPSMRNGRHASDRGNAILSTVALGALDAVQLPYIRQRRVAVRADITGVAGVALCSAHLDTRGQPRRGDGGPRYLGPFGAGRAAQAAALAAALRGAAHTPALLLGADLNSYLGALDPALAPLRSIGLREGARLTRWGHTYHRGRLRLPLDHLLWAPGDGVIEAVRVVRLDARPGDRGARVFGSDHHPLLADVRLG
ncbi:MAG: endonuclease/exonuclease/phosphatase family protein [Gemmatimonadota bacterium]